MGRWKAWIRGCRLWRTVRGGRHGKVGDSRGDTRTVSPSVPPSAPPPRPSVWDLTVTESPELLGWGKRRRGRRRRDPAGGVADARPFARRGSWERGETARPPLVLLSLRPCRQRRMWHLLVQIRHRTADARRLPPTHTSALGNCSISIRGEEGRGASRGWVVVRRNKGPWNYVPLHLRANDAEQRAVSPGRSDKGIEGNHLRARYSRNTRYWIIDSRLK